MDLDLAAHGDESVQAGDGVVVGAQGDAGPLQSVGHGAVDHLDGLLGAVHLDGHREGTLNVQGCQVAAEGGVVDPVALPCFQAGQAHQPGGVALLGKDHLPHAGRVGDIGQPQAGGGHHQGHHQAQSHGTQGQRPGRNPAHCARTVLLRLVFIVGNDTKQLLSFYSLDLRRRALLPALNGHKPGRSGTPTGRRFTSSHSVFMRCIVCCNLHILADKPLFVKSPHRRLIAFSHTFLCILHSVFSQMTNFKAVSPDFRPFLKSYLFIKF